VSTTWYGVATFTGVGECDAAIATKVKPADDKAVEQAAYECNSCLRGGAPAIVWRVFRNRGEPVKWACMPDNSN
jgi:hypothetical protein